MGQLKSNFQYNMKLLAVFVALVMAVHTVMVVMDMVDTVASVPPMPMLTMVMDMDVVMDMVVTDTVDTTVERDLLMLKPKLKLSHGTDMDTPDSHTLMVDTDTHTLMEVTTTVARDPLNHTTDMVDTDHTEDTDMAVMATAMVVKSYLQEAKGFYYLIFRK